MKVARAEETAQRKLNWLAKKQWKADEREAKAAEKAAQGAANVDGRSHGCGRGHGRGIG